MTKRIEKIDYAPNTVFIAELEKGKPMMFTCNHHGIGHNTMKPYHNSLQSHSRVWKEVILSKLN